MTCKCEISDGKNSFKNERCNSQLSCIRYDLRSKLFIMSSLGGEVGDGWDGHISFSPLFVSDCFCMVVYIFIQGEKRKIFPLGRGVHLINH